MDKFGYHVGELQKPAETISARGANLKSISTVSKVGWLGTGYYFFGKKEDAEDYAEQTGRPIQQIDLSKFKLYKPADGVTFYQGITDASVYLSELSKEDISPEEIKESVLEVAEWFEQIPGITIQKAAKGILDYYKDIKSGKDGTILSNRVLGTTYEGIDNRGNDRLDHYGVGSVIFSEPGKPLDKSTYITIEMQKEGLESDLDNYADKQLTPKDVVFTKHFFDRMVDPRNQKAISKAELLGFFKRLARHKTRFLEFLKKYREFVVTDKRYDINIPFVNKFNQLIAKTIMRKRQFTTSNPVFAFEAEGDPIDSTGFSFKDNVSATQSVNRVKGSSLSTEDKIRLIKILISRVQSQFKRADNAEKKAVLRSSLKKLNNLLVFFEKGID